MNKKFLSTVLFGALLLGSASTFVSCKDYDDDIQNLQEQINKLATKDDLSAQINTLQAALNNAAANASDAIAKATAAEAAAKAAGDSAAAAAAAADKAAAEAEAAAIKGVQAEVEKAKADLEALVAKGLEENAAEMAKMREEVAAATQKVEEIVGKIADMVTSVELVYSNSAQSYWTDERHYVQDANGDWVVVKMAADGTLLTDPTNSAYDSADIFNDWASHGYEGQSLWMSTAFEKDNLFSKGVNNAITFVKDDQVQTGSSFIIRVSPTNAVITPDMISLKNSLGESLDDIINIDAVEKYKGLLTRGVEGNGLWVVSVSLKNYDQKQFLNTVRPYGSYLSYCVAVNNTQSTATTREVISSYDLSVLWEKYQPASELNFFVNEKNVNDIHNRFSNTEDGKNKGKVHKELRWEDEPAVAATDLKEDGTPKATSNAVLEDKNGPDNRQVLAPYPAVVGKELTISLSTRTDKVAAPSNIRAMYVVLDKDNALESAPSEINAWESYKYTGLNTVVEGTSTKISISPAEGQTVINDIVGFRVFAVNFDGTLVDPDGKAFYVKLGNAADAWGTVNTVIVPDADATNNANDEKSAKVDVTLTKLADATQASWTTDWIVNKTDNHVFDAYFVDKDGTVLFATNNLGVIPTDFSKVAKVYTVPTKTDWTMYKDNKVYNGALTIKNADGFTLATLNVTMQKVLPTTMPAKYALKDKQVINGIYNCFMIADDWTAEAATKGRMPIQNLVFFGEGLAEQYVVEFATSDTKKDENGVLKSKTVAGDKAITVDKQFVDNKTEHATTVSYNYGLISSETKDAKGNIVDYLVEGDSFKTVYCCFYKPEVHTWNWATREQLGGDYNTLKNKNKPEEGYKADPASTTLTYGTAPAEAYAGFIFGHNSIDSTFSTLLNKTYKGSLVVKSAKLISDATQNEDYFDVDPTLKFTVKKVNLGSNPKADVPSTLIINCKDSYGHDVVITLKMTVKPRK